MSNPDKPEIATERTRLAIPYDDRQRAIAAAGKLSNGENALELDREAKVWYAKPGANLTRLEPWIYDPNKVEAEKPLDISAVEAEFSAWLEERGAILNGPVEFDGQKHYVDTEDGKAGSKKGVYAAFLDGRPAGWYRDYKNGGEIQKWVSKGQKPNPEQMAMLRADAAARREQRAAERADKFDQTAGRLMEAFNTLPDATGAEAYHQTKQINAAGGVKADQHGNVVIPLHNADGEFRTLERIWPDGTKHLEKDGQAWGSFFVAGGQLRDGENILYAEGYATAASISEATGRPVVMTVNAGNMVEVARHLNEQYPNSQHFFLADNDIYKDVNAGLNYANEAAELTGGHVVTPTFREPREGLTDFNDLHVEEGLNAVNWQVETAIENVTRMENMADQELQDQSRKKANDEVTAAPTDNASAAPVSLQDDAPATAPAAPADNASAAPVSLQDDAPATAPAAPADNANAAPVSLQDDAPATAPAAPADNASTAPVSLQDDAPATAPAAPADNASAAPVSLQDDAPATASAAPADNTSAASYADDYAQWDNDPDDINASMEAYAAMQAEPQTKGKPYLVVPEKEDATQKAEQPAQESAEQAPFAKASKNQAQESEAQVLNGFTWAPTDNASIPPKERIDLDALMKDIRHRDEKDYVAYMLRNDDAFYDYGTHMRMANDGASKNDGMILAALQTAMAQHKRGIEITGSDEFKERVYGLMAEYKIEAKLSNPQQRARLQDVVREKAAAKDAYDTQQKSQQTPGTADGVKESKPQQDTQSQKADRAQQEKAAVVATAAVAKAAAATQRTDAPGKEWASGAIKAHGKAHYKFDEKESMSYYVTLVNGKQEKTIWGKDLERAVQNAGVDKDRLIYAKCNGFKDVTVTAPVRDKDNNILRYEPIQARRNEWEIRPVYPQPTPNNPEALKPADLVAYDANTYKMMRGKIEALGINLSHEPVPKNELFWFKPNGAPAAADMPKPRDYKLPAENASAGTPLLMSPVKKGESPEYILLESKKGFLQGAVRDKETGLYHSVIGKVNTKRMDNGEKRDYITLAAVNANAPTGMVMHGYGNANEKGNGLVYKNLLNKENNEQHLQPVSDDVKNKPVMKRIMHSGNAAKKDDDERRMHSHAPSAKASPKM
jgi:putative DNA primase/helicase